MHRTYCIRRIIRAVTTAVPLLVGTVGAWAAESPQVPDHVLLARQVVENIKPENNSYSNSNRYVRLPGDFLSAGYTVHTDCTGFVFDMLERNGYRIRFSTRAFSDRYGIADTVDGIRRNETFDRLTLVQDLRAGDVVAWKYMEGANSRGLGGHIVMVNQAPVRVEKPTQQATDAGLTMWSVEVIDSSTGPASPDDTRYVQGTSAQDAANALNTQKPQKLNGVGRGRFYLYADAAGALKAVGYGFPQGTAEVRRRGLGHRDGAAP
ncbi:MAG: hypothetical protein E6R08_04865 [Nevskiaceae bacterium]|nr:MAG: hypothetical protein E6R08_04865 [Nevskiaceae bacterium]